MKQIIAIAFLTVPLAACDSSSELHERWTPLDNGVIVQVAEKIGYSGYTHEPKMQLMLTSTKIYGTTCYTFATSMRRRHRSLYVWISDVGPRSLSCGRSEEPARSNLDLVDLTDGKYELQIISELGADHFEIDISDEFIEVTSLLEPSFTRLAHSRAWRVKRNTFAYKCGTLCENIYLCSEFADRLIEELGVQELEVPADAFDAFGGPPQGHYCDGPLRVFLGDSEETFLAAGALLKEFRKSRLDNVVGASIRLVSWKGEHSVGAE